MAEEKKLSLKIPEVQEMADGLFSFIGRKAHENPLYRYCNPRDFSIYSQSTVLRELKLRVLRKHNRSVVVLLNCAIQT